MKQKSKEAHRFISVIWGSIDSEFVVIIVTLQSTSYFDNMKKVFVCLVGFYCSISDIMVLG